MAVSDSIDSLVLKIVKKSLKFLYENFATESGYNWLSALCIVK